MEPTSSLPTFRVDTEIGEGVALLSLFGTLDMFAVATFETTIRTVEGRTRRVVVDLRGLTQLGSSGLGAILRAHRRSRVDGWRLAVVRGSPQIERVFSMSSASRRPRMVNSPEELQRRRPSGFRGSYDGD